MASASVMRSTVPFLGKAGHVGSLSGHAARITDLRTLSWSSGAANPPWGYLSVSSVPPEEHSIEIYIKDFAKHACPLTESLQGKYKDEVKPTDGTVKLDATGLPKKRKRFKLPAKEMKIEWTKEIIDGFEKLKQSLIDMVNEESKDLCLPQLVGKWLIRCDARDPAVGGALEQLQPYGTYRPVACYSRNLQGEQAGTTKDGFTLTKHTGRYGWTPREKETYTIVSCLLKFQSWIGGQEITVQTDHSSIVKWYKEDLCTVPGLVGRRGRWHEFLSTFNLMIEYRSGPENHVGNTLSRWAYPAGTAQNTSFHGSDQDLVECEEDKTRERDYIRNELRNTYPEAFTAINAIRGGNATMVEADLGQIRQAQKPSAVTPSGRLVDSMDSMDSRGIPV